jgi:cyclopropane fatty-acyl-phospholipid synthase-like methyltransferase
MLLYYLISFLTIVMTILFIWSWFSGGPYTPITNRKLNLLVEKLPIASGKRLYDLGCGDGRVLCRYAARYGVLGVGYEINPLAYLAARIRILLSGQGSSVKIYLKDMFSADIESADVVFVHLLPHGIRTVLSRLRPRFKKDAMLLSYGVPITQAGFTNEQIIELDVSSAGLLPNVIYVYRY